METKHRERGSFIVVIGMLVITALVLIVSFAWRGNESNTAGRGVITGGAAEFGGMETTEEGVQEVVGVPTDDNVLDELIAPVDVSTIKLNPVAFKATCFGQRKSVIGSNAGTRVETSYYSHDKYYLQYFTVSNNGEEESLRRVLARNGRVIDWYEAQHVVNITEFQTPLEGVEIGVTASEQLVTGDYPIVPWEVVKVAVRREGAIVSGAQRVFGLDAIKLIVKDGTTKRESHVWVEKNTGIKLMVRSYDTPGKIAGLWKCDSLSMNAAGIEETVDKVVMDVEPSMEYDGFYRLVTSMSANLAGSILSDASRADRHSDAVGFDDATMVFQRPVFLSEWTAGQYRWMFIGRRKSAGGDSVHAFITDVDQPFPHPAVQGVVGTSSMDANNVDWVNVVWNDGELLYVVEGSEDAVGSVHTVSNSMGQDSED